MKIYRSKKAECAILETYEELLCRWQVPVEQREVPTRYGSTHVNVFGRMDGPAVVLFHGVGDDSALMWLYNAAGLAPHFRLYAVDTLGGPGKSRPNEKYDKSFDDVLWIDDILDSLALDKVDLLGVSHGGYLVQYYKLKRPHRVNRAVALASSVAAGATGSPLKTMMRIFLPEALFPTKGNIRRLLIKLTGSNSDAFTENPLVLNHFTHLMRGYNNMAMAYHKVEGFTDEQIDSIRGDILFLMGDEDPFAIYGGKEALEKYKMNTRFFPKVGHGINHEIADEINHILISYLKDGYVKSA